MLTHQLHVNAVLSDATTTRSPQPNPKSEQFNLIKSASTIEEKYITASMVLAFNDDPIMRWMYPDPYQYLTHFPDFVRAFGGQAFAHHTAYAVNGYTGAALWLPPNIEPNTEALIDLFKRSVFEAQQANLFAVLEQMEHYHIRQPHWYLALLGIEPTQQRKGYGSVLMQAVLRQCDRDRIPAYLESSKPSNIPFYERHGFKQIGTIQVGDFPPLFPMVRYPVDTL